MAELRRGEAVAAEEHRPLHAVARPNQLQQLGDHLRGQRCEGGGYGWQLWGSARRCIPILRALPEDALGLQASEHI